MKGLTTEQLLYLFYARAYRDDDGTITQGRVKERLPKAAQSKAKSVYESLEKFGMISYARRYRFSVTDAGALALIDGLSKTDYQFESNKGYKVTNELLRCVKEISAHKDKKKSISDEEFESIFQEKYLEERAVQAKSGIDIVKKESLFSLILQQYSLSRSKLFELFEQLQQSGKISVFQGRDDELIEWVD